MHSHFGNVQIGVGLILLLDLKSTKKIFHPHSHLLMIFYKKGNGGKCMNLINVNKKVKELLDTLENENNDNNVTYSIKIAVDGNVGV